jgi:dTDP-4-amino-4,6-dideoxygalactose transaminase
MAYDETELCNYQYVIVEIDEGLAGISRDDLVKLLHTENVLARRYFYPGCHQMEPYRSKFPHARQLLVETEKVVHRVMSLPTGTAVSTNDIQEICAIIRLAVTLVTDEMISALQKREEVFVVLFGSKRDRACAG